MAGVYVGELKLLPTSNGYNASVPTCSHWCVSALIRIAVIISYTAPRGVNQLGGIEEKKEGRGVDSRNKGKKDGKYGVKEKITL